MNNNDILDAAKELKERHFYKEAAELVDAIFDRALSKELKVRALRLKAECVYQNYEIPAPQRFDEALEILENKLFVNDFEAKRLKGDIYKRRYQLYERMDDLVLAIERYTDTALHDEDDQGYGAVNAIYLILVRKSIETHRDFGREIDELSKKVLALEPQADALAQANPWIYQTIAEVYVVRGDYAQAKMWVVKMQDRPQDGEQVLRELLETESEISEDLKARIELALQYDIWSQRDRQTAAEQFINVYFLEHKETDHIDFDAFLDMLRALIGESAEALVESMKVGKVGLSLSGGGFRASIFHIGVLKRLAEQDFLRHVQVISCVSGGSIVGMHYYIKLKELLETRNNEQLIKQDYIDLVEDLKNEFIKGVQTNIRMQAFDCGSKSVTHQLGELYQKHFYDQAVHAINPPKKMKELMIHPKVNDTTLLSFHPAYNNVILKNKVPILVINATNLNTGHNWKFTAVGMGESPYMYDLTVDHSPVFEYSPYANFGAFEDFTIGDAVAASSCVPMLFSPLELEEVYEDITVKLVDGGAYDNQGVASLVDAQCEVMLVSDATRELLHEKEPSSLRHNVLFRVLETMMQRNRDSELMKAKGMLKNGRIKGLSLIHYNAGDVAQRRTPQSILPASEPLFETGVDPQVLARVSQIRTDLDAFHDLESQALIDCSYRITGAVIRHNAATQSCWERWQPVSSGSPCPAFNTQLANHREDVLSILDASQRVLLKNLTLANVPWKWLLFCFVIFTILLTCPPVSPLAECLLTVFFAVWVVIWVLGYCRGKKLGLTKPLHWYNKGLDCVLSPIARVYLKRFNKYYLKKGKLGKSQVKEII